MDNREFIVFNLNTRRNEFLMLKYFVHIILQKFSEILQQAKDDSGKTNKNEGPSRSSCFNCLGNHSLRDCPQPQDPSAITKNRRQFSARFNRAQNKTR
jgi:hypothetical protein